MVKRHEWNAPNKARVLTEVAVNVAQGKSEHEVLKSKRDNGSIERGGWPSKASFYSWQKDARELDFDEACEPKRKHAVMLNQTGENIKLSAEQLNLMADGPREVRDKKRKHFSKEFEASERTIQRAARQRQPPIVRSKAPQEDELTVAVHERRGVYGNKYKGKPREH